MSHAGNSAVAAAAVSTSVKREVSWEESMTPLASGTNWADWVDEDDVQEILPEQRMFPTEPLSPLLFARDAYLTRH